MYDLNNSIIFKKVIISYIFCTDYYYLLFCITFTNNEIMHFLRLGVRVLYSCSTLSLSASQLSDFHLNNNNSNSRGLIEDLIRVSNLNISWQLQNRSFTISIDKLIVLALRGYSPRNLCLQVHCFKSTIVELYI